MGELELIRGSALAALGENRWDDAADLYTQLFARASSSTAIRADDATNFGALLRRLGRVLEASAHYQLWISRFPQHLELRVNGINCLIDLNHLDLADRWTRTGLERLPDNAELLLAQGRVWQRQGQLAAARGLLERLTQTDPQLLRAWLELAVTCHRLGDLQAALAASRQVSRIDPSCAGGWGNQITLLKELGQLDQASQLAAEVPANLHNHPDLRRARADLWMEQQLITEAEVELAELCQLQPTEPGHWLNRAACLKQLKHFIAAARVLKTGLRWVPTNPQLQESLGHCLAEIGQPDRGMALLRQCLPWPDNLSDSSHASVQFLGAGYGSLRPVELQELARSWERRKQNEGVGPLWADRIRDPLAGRRLRVGYLSADMCNHPVGRFLLPVLKHHDAESVEVWGLSCGPHRDSITDAIRSCCQHWREVRFGSDLEIARLIADLGLDVLVELGGYTGFSRIGVMVHRPAPTQLSYLGYFAPTYLAAIDGWIGDRELFDGLNPTDRQAHRLVAVERGYMAHAESDLPAPERANGIPFRFGSFNHSRKLSRQAIDLFCAVMEAVPEAQLLLKSVSFIEAAERDRIRDRFGEAGLASERLVVMPWVEGHLNHLASYSEVDVALDPLPYGGATTSCEALSMGVPVITLASEGMVGRLSASILASSGHPQWIARQGQQYVSIAKQLAAEGPRTTKQRMALRAAVQLSPLGDGARLASALEAHYRHMASEALAAPR